MFQPKQVFLSLGSNLGDRRTNLANAMSALEAERVEVVTCSSIYETEPQDVSGQPWFLNMVAEARSTYFPVQLLGVLQRIEHRLGRRRVGVVPRGPRLIDIDILLYGRVTLTTDALQIPHPRMFDRRFVLQPLVEIAPDVKNPLDGRSCAQILEGIRGQIIRKVAAASCAVATSRTTS